MAKLPFKAMVKTTVGQVLGTHGFVEVPINQTGAVCFERMVRQHSQIVTFESLDRYWVIGKRAFRFVLKAAKQPMGTQSPLLTGGRDWIYATPEELKECLDDSLKVLLDGGFAWLDAYTPGNVPDWSVAIHRHIQPLLAPLGFKRADMIDVAIFRLEDAERVRSISFDFRRPSIIRVYAMTLVKPSSVSDMQLPPWSYQTETELENRVQEAREALLQTLGDWFQV